MIKEFVDEFFLKKEYLESIFAERHPSDYIDIVKIVVGGLAKDNDNIELDVDRITEIDPGHYQGTLLYVIAETGYQPRNYWYVKVSYGSCSHCDTLQSIQGYSDEKPNEEQIKDYMTLALHIVQGLKKMGDDEA